MESVYFGKETPSDLNTADENTLKERRPREYYFPNEAARGLRILDFLSVLLLSAILDIFVIVAIIPFAVNYMKDFIPLFNFVNIDLFPYADILAGYVLFSVIFGLLIRNAGRRRIYVGDNGTFYFIKKKVRVKTQREFLFETRKHANKRINKSYTEIIKKADKWIEKGSFRIKKTLTDCKISDDLHESGTYFSGYNEKTLNDEEFTIPSSYMKYDPAEDHLKGNALQCLVLFILKAGLYALIFMTVLKGGSNGYAIYERDILSYIHEKEAVLSSYGYYEDSYGNTYDHIDFFIEGDDYKGSRIRYGFYPDEKKGLTDEFIYISLSLYEDDDISYIKPLIKESFGGRITDDHLALIDRIMQKYAEEGKNVSEYISDDKIYINVEVEEKPYKDYDLQLRIYIRDKEKEIH